MVNVGDKAPDFTLKAHDKSEVTFISFSGSKVILSFYPAAFTGVCQNQACTIMIVQMLYHRQTVKYWASP